MFIFSGITFFDEKLCYMVMLDVLSVLNAYHRKILDLVECGIMLAMA